MMMVLGAALLGGCAMTGPTGLSVHEALLYGDVQQRLAWVYGDLDGTGQAEISLGGDRFALSRAAGSNSGSALLVGGRSAYSSNTLSGAVAQPKVIRTAAGLFDVASAGGISELYYTDGRNWYLLNATAGSGISAQAVAGLQGAGELTPEEAATLTRSLSGQGSLAVGVLSPSSVPDDRLKVEPAPQEHRLTALSVIRVGRSSASPMPMPTPTPAPTPTPEPGGNVSDISYRIVDQGNNATASAPGVQVATTAAQAQALYAVAYGNQTSRPSAPAMTGKTLVGIFMGTRNTGGYSVDVASVTAAGGRVTVNVREETPGSDSFTTQALTSPWIIVELSGSFTDVQVQGLGRSAGIGGVDR